MNCTKHSLLLVVGFFFTAGFSTAVFAFSCNAHALLACERAQRTCTGNPDDCQRVFERCMELAGCEIP